MKLCGLLSLLTVLLFSVYSTEAISKEKHNKVVTCYIASWAYYRKNGGKFGPNDLPRQFCTHVIYAFAGLNASSWTIRSLDKYADIEAEGIGNYRRLTELRKNDPDIKISLAIGGWNEGSKNYSELASSPERRKTFVKSVVDFLGVYGFDGFDLDWEYPGERGGAMHDKENFVSLVKELKEAFVDKSYLLTAAIGAAKSTIDKAYDILALSKYLDYIHVMSYDYHGTWDSKVLPNAPLRDKNGASVAGSVEYLLKIGAPRNKLVLGVPMYGRSYILASAMQTNTSAVYGQSPIGQPCLKTGFKGPYTNQDGFLGYNEICETVKQDSANWKIGWHSESSTPYAVNGDRAIVYDDSRSMNEKVKFAMELNLAGIMVWSIDTDNTRGDCAALNADVLDHAAGNNFNLMRSINLALATYGNTNDIELTTSTPSSTDQICYSSLLILFALFVSYCS